MRRDEEAEANSKEDFSPVMWAQTAPATVSRGPRRSRGSGEQLLEPRPFLRRNSSRRGIHTPERGSQTTSWPPIASVGVERCWRGEVKQFLEVGSDGYGAEGVAEDHGAVGGVVPGQSAMDFGDAEQHPRPP